MKRSGLLCVLVSAIIAAGCGDPPPPTEVPALSSRVELAAGDVWMDEGDGQTRLITGAMLPEKAGVTVGKGGRALVRLGTGAGVFFRAGTRATIDGGKIVLAKGELWADVPEDEREMGHFEAGGVTVTATDAGIDIAVEDDGAVSVYVARGLAVIAGPGGRTEVQSGERARIEGKEAPALEPVSFWEDWTGGMADRELLAGLGGKAAGRIYGINRDELGSPPEELQITYQAVRVHIRDGIAHTTVDQRFFNPTSTDVEGWYWFTVPEGGAVERFAWEVDGVLVDGEMIERKQAAAAYESAVRARTFEPALLEWINGRTFRAKIFPVPATGEKRVVLSYTEMLPLADGVYRYVYPMGGGDEVRIQEFSLNVDLGDEGRDMSLSTLQDATVEEDGSRVTMRRSGFVPRSDFLLEIAPKEEVPPLRVARFSAGEDEADYVMIRYSPEVEWGKLKEVPGDVVVVLDTSAGGDDSDRQVRSDVVEAILRALSEGDHFAVVAADLKPRVLYPAKGLAAASEGEVSAAVEKLAEVPSAGATDLGEMFGAALGLVHEAQQPAVVYVGDGKATVGETKADELAQRLRRSLGDSRARLFTIAVGADANHSLLERLARVGGGRMFRIDSADQTVQEALRFAGMLKTPTVTDLEIDAGSGLDQVFSTATGKVSEGEEVIVLARTHHALPGEIKVTGRLADEAVEKTYEADVEKGAEYGYIPSMWARLYLERLMGEGADERRGSIISLGLTYGLMTPFTSFLVLRNESAYEARGIKRRTRYRSWSVLDAEGDDLEELAARDVAGFPLFALGCASGEEAESSEQAAMRQVMEILEDKSIDAPTAPASEPAPVASTAAPMDQAEAEEADYERAPSPKKSAKRRKSSGGSSSGLGSELDDLLAGAGKAEMAKEKASAYGTRGAKDKGIGTGAGGGGIGTGIINPYASAMTGNEEQVFFKGVCSDASRRPLAHRRILWKARLRSATSASDYQRIFGEAGKRCELPRWKDRKVLLDLIESKCKTGPQVRALLNVFAQYPKFRNYLRRRIMRRTLDPDSTGLYYGTGVDWGSVERGLAALKTEEDRVEKVREILQGREDDPAGRTLLARVLVEAGQLEEARAVASRLRRDGLAGPPILALLCDLEAEAGMEDEARRTCSELVEFNSDDPMTRQRLGDLFLRHGWYEAAYRQYKTLVDDFGEVPVALLRLAMAAAGMGKIDEALRIERSVASGDGEPGAGDPRRWARLHSAARLARMILEAKASNDAGKVKAMERSLKRTQVFGAGAKLMVLVWEDLEVGLDLVAEVDEEPYSVSEKVGAGQVGLTMIDVGSGLSPEASLSVFLVGGPVRRPVGFSIFTFEWDGKKFSIEEEKGELPAGEEDVTLIEGA